MTIFLDHNSTTNLLPEAKDAMLSYMSEALNASSIHSNGRKAKKLIEDTRKNILNSLKVSSSDYEVIFTSSGTESNNLIIQSDNFKNIIISSIEHPSISEPAKQKSCAKIKVNQEGQIDLSHLESLVQNATENTLLSIIYANNETGVIQDFDAIFAIIKRTEKDIIFHSDLSQSYGKIEIDFTKHPFDIATISGHKFGGPQGSSAIVKRKNLVISPLFYGGGQEFGIRPGTENIGAIAGFSAAISHIPHLIEKYKQVRILRDYLESQLKDLSAKVFINSANASRNPNTCSFGIEGLKNDVLLINLDLRGFAVSAGSACSSGKIEISDILLAFGYNPEKASSVIRVSLGITNTKEEIDLFVSAVKDILIQQKIINKSNYE